MQPLFTVSQNRYMFQRFGVWIGLQDNCLSVKNCLGGGRIASGWNKGWAMRVSAKRAHLLGKVLLGTGGYSWW